MKRVAEDNIRQSKTIETLKDEIYELISDFFGNGDGKNSSHTVARDFSEDNLDETLSYYYEYAMK